MEEEIAKKFAYLKDGHILIKTYFPKGSKEFWDTLERIRSLPERRFYGKLKLWTCALSVDSVETLRSWGFVFGDALAGWYDKRIEPKEGVKIFIDLFVCPLYRRLNDANRSILQEKRTFENNEKKLCQGENAENKKDSVFIIERKCGEPGLEKEGIREHKESDVDPINTKKTFVGTEKSQKKTWGKFQRGQWTVSNKDCYISREFLVEMWLSKGIFNPDETCERYFQKCTACVQSGLRQCETENSDGIGRSVSQELLSKEERQEKNKSTTSPWMECDTLVSLQSMITIKGLKKGLYPFQFEDVLKMEQRKGRVIIASEMGLGKTIQTIGWLQLHKLQFSTVIVVCPASVKLNWEKEINDSLICPPPVHLIYGRCGGDISKRAIIIINYDILKDRLKELLALSPDVVVLDECHAIKNSSSLRTKAVKALCKDVKHIIPLSGTPITNRPIEFYNIISIIDPFLFPNKWTYAKKYCGAFYDGFGWNVRGASNTVELHKKLTSTIMIRRKKEDVLKELPSKVRTTVPLEIDNPEEYAQVEKDVIRWISENEGKEKAEKAKKAKVLVEIEKLKQTAVRGKMNQIIYWITDFLDSEEKLVVFGIHTFIIDTIYDAFEKIAVKVDGSVSVTKRQEAIYEFQNDSRIKLFVGNMRAAGAGINLFASSNVAFLEYSFVPGEHLQAEDRVHRIGQKSDSVNVWYLVAKGTIEEEIVSVLEEKSKILNQVLDGATMEDSGTFNDILERLQGQS